MVFRSRKCKRRLLPNVCAVLLVIVVVITVAVYVFRVQIYGLQKEIHRQYTSNININQWTQNTYTSCKGNFIGYGHQFAVLHDVIIQPGGTNFSIPCEPQAVPQYWFDYGKEGTHLDQWMRKITPRKTADSFDKIELAKVPYGVAVMRYEYANLYHTMTDWYNVFLVVKLLNISFHDIQLIMFDTHAKGHLDETWKTLFGNNISVSNITKPLHFENVIWCVLGYESPLNYHGLQELPFIESFHSFFLQQHGVKTAKNLDCDNLSILFLWRRDYIAHPKSTGLISRKIHNEDELLTYFTKQYPKATIRGLQLDTLTFQEQVRIISQTDILVSMHGAGLSHILFLPKHAGVVELFTLYWTRSGMTHFKAMARWRGLPYSSWQNLNPSNEIPQFYTYIPPPSLEQHVRSVYKQLCS